jgi:DnaJ-class molecular chaperone
MADARHEYWKEQVADALHEAGVTATADQIADIAQAMEGAQEGLSLAFYTPENPLAGELRETKAALKAEQELVFCRACNGHGRIQTQGPYHGSNSQCWKCSGNGKHKP